VLARRLLAVALVGVAAGAVIWFAFLRPSAQAVRSSPARGALLIAPQRRHGLPAVAGSALTPPPARLFLRARDGRPAFVDVWASWCVPCQEEAPMLAALARTYRGRIRFLGIDVEDTRGDARAFERKHAIGYPSIFDPNASLAGKLGFYGLPTAYLVDHKGRIAAVLTGKQQRQAIVRRLARLLAEPRGGS
jgi:thiol-disulfide isomerase/thioredoxin